MTEPKERVWTPDTRPFITPEKHPIRTYGPLDWKPEYTPTFWEDPRWVRRAYDFIRSRPDEMIPEWMPREKVEAAYKYFREANENINPLYWKYLHPDDPARSFLKSIEAPPYEYIAPGGITYPRVAYPPPSEELPPGVVALEALTDPNLPGWQHLVMSAMGSPWLGAGMFGAVGGFIGLSIGGPVGGGVGAALGAGAGAYAMSHPETTFSRWLMKLDIPREYLERGVGTFSQLAAAGMEPDKYGSVEEVIKNLPAAWDASYLTYMTLDPFELANIFPRGESILLFWRAQAAAARGDLKEAERLMERRKELRATGFAQTGQVHQLGVAEPVDIDEVEPLVAVVEARRRIMGGEAPQEVYDDITEKYGFSGMFRWLVSGFVADPLMILPTVSSGVVKTVARASGNKPLARAFSTTSGLLQGAQQYKVFIRTGKAGKMVDELTNFDRLMAGVTKAGEFVELAPSSDVNILQKAFNRITGGMDPSSKARYMMGIASDNAGILYSTVGDNPHEMVRLTKLWGSSPVDAAAELNMKFLGAPEGYTVGLAIRDFGKVADELLLQWDTTTPNRTVLLKVSQLLGEEPGQLLSRLGKADDWAVEFNRIITAAKGSTDDFAKSLVKQADQGTFNAEVLKRVLDIYVGKDTIPWHPSEFRFVLHSNLIDFATDWAVKAYNVKKMGAIFKLSNTLKSAQSLVLLGLNPGYFVNNQVNNMVTRLYSGVFGYVPAKTINRWIERFGIEPHRLRAGFGAADIGPEPFVKGPVSAKAEVTIRKAVMPDQGPVWRAADNVVRAGNEKLGLFSRMSQASERIESTQAYFIAMRRMFGQLWRKDKGGFNSMPPALERALIDIDPNLPGIIYNVVEGGMNMDEITRALMTTEPIRRGIAGQLDDVSRRMGVDPSMTKDMLETTGVWDVIDEGLAKATTPEERISVFDTAEARIQSHLDDLLAREMKIRSEEVTARISKEGFAPVVEIWDDLQLTLAETWNRHFVEWENTFALADLKPDLRRKLILSQRTRADAEWARMWKFQEATHQGIFDGLGFEGTSSKAIIKGVTDTADSWKKFFNTRNKKIDEFFNTVFTSKERRSAVWNDLTNELDDLYRKHGVKEVQIQKAMDKAFTDAFVEKFGSQYKGAVKKWRSNMETFYKERVGMMSRFRQSIASAPRDERALAWTKFLDEEYLPFLRGFFQEQIDGAHELYGLVSEVPGKKPPGKKPPEVPEMKLPTSGKKPPPETPPAAPAPVPEGPPPGAPPAAPKAPAAPPVPEAPVAKKPLTPTEKWQEVPADMTVPGGPGLEVRMDLTTGKNFVRKTPGFEAQKRLAEIREWANKFGIHTADETGNMIPGSDNHILNIINKYGDNKFKSLDEVNPAIAAEAFQKRQWYKKVGKDPDVDKFMEVMEAIPEVEKVLSPAEEVLSKPMEGWSPAVREEYNWILSDMLLGVDIGEPGKRVFKYKDYPGDSFSHAVASTYPEWYGEIAKSAYYKGERGKTAVLSALDDMVKGDIDTNIALVRKLLSVADEKAPRNAEFAIATGDMGGALRPYEYRLKKITTYKTRSEGYTGYEGILENNITKSLPELMVEIMEDPRIADTPEAAKLIDEILAYQDKYIAELDKLQGAAVAPEVTDVTKMVDVTDLEPALREYLATVADQEKFIQRLMDTKTTIDQPGLLTAGDARTMLRDGFRDVYGLPLDEVDAMMRVTDAIAETWAKHNNATPAEWYNSRIGGIGHGDPSLLSLAQGKQLSFGEFVDLDFPVPLGGASKTPKTVFGWKRGVDFDTLYDVARFDDQFQFRYIMYGDERAAMAPSRRLLDSIRNNKEITVYRAYRKGDTIYGGLLPGSYVTESFEYAQLHGRAILGGDYKIYKLKVFPDELASYLDPHEFIYVPRSKEIGYQRYLKQLEEGTLFQSPKGGIDFLDDGRAILLAFEKPDVSTAVHEVAHIFRRDLPANDLRVAEDWVGAKGGIWNDVHEEKFARGFERYLAEGVAPAPALAEVFRKFKEWLLAIYTKIRGSVIDVDLTPEISKVFDRVLSDDAIVNVDRTGQSLMIKPEQELPLFTGAAQRTKVDVFRPVEAPRQPIIPGVEDVYRPAMAGAKVAVETIGDKVYFIKNGSLYRAPKGSPLDVNGYPMGARWEAPGHMAEARLQQLRDPFMEVPGLASRAVRKMVQDRMAELDIGIEWWDDVLKAPDPQRELVKLLQSELKEIEDNLIFADKRQRRIDIILRYPEEDQVGLAKRAEDLRRMILRAHDEIGVPSAIRTTVSQSELVKISKAAEDIQFLIVKGGGMATKSNVEDQIMKMFNIDRGLAHDVMNTLEQQNRLPFVFSEGKAYWNNAEMMRPEPKLEAYPGLEIERIVRPARVELPFKMTEGEARIYAKLVEQQPPSLSSADLDNAFRGVVAPGRAKLAVQEMIEKGLTIEHVHSKAAPEITTVKQMPPTEQPPRTLFQAAAMTDAQFDDFLRAFRRQVANPSESLQERLSFAKLTIIDEVDRARRVRLWRTLVEVAPDVADELNTQMTGRASPWVDTEGGGRRILFQTDEGAVVQSGDGSVSRVVKGEDDVLPVGPLAPGTVERVAGTQYSWAMEQDAWVNRVRPVLDELKAQVLKDPGVETTFRYGDLAPENQMAMKKWLNEVQGDMSTTKMAAMRYGESRRDAALLNYSRRYGIDSYLQLVWPYQFWYTRTMFQWALRALDRTAFFAGYARLRETQRNMLSMPGFPQRLEKRIKIPMPFLPEWAGGGTWVDPLRKFFPVEELTDQIEYHLMQKTQVEQRAGYILMRLLEDGEIDQGEFAQAFSDRTGAVWERAFEQAQLEYSGGQMNPMDMVGIIISPALWWSIPYYLLSGRASEMSPLPATRLGQALRTAAKDIPLVGGIMAGMGNLLAWPEETLRRRAGISEYGEWGEYYIDRQITNMVGEGLISVKDAQIAMAERQGPIFEEAQQRVALENALRMPGALPLYAVGQKAPPNEILSAMLTGWLPTGLFPDGELKLRGLKSEYDKARNAYNRGDSGALQNFFADHPEYEARLALNKEPEERLRQYLVSEIWEKYAELGATHKEDVRNRFGLLFQEAFLNRDTRSYDAIDLETLAMWAQSMGAKVPVTKETPEMETMDMYYAPQSEAEMLDTYQAERNEMFPNWYAIQQRYYGLEKENRSEYLERYPELKEYWEWRREKIAQNPELGALISAPMDTQEVDITDSPPLIRALLGYYYAGQPLGKGARAELQRRWQLAGRPGESFEVFLEVIMRVMFAK